MRTKKSFEQLDLFTDYSTPQVNEWVEVFLPEYGELVSGQIISVCPGRPEWFYVRLEKGEILLKRYFPELQFLL